MQSEHELWADIKCWESVKVILDILCMIAFFGTKKVQYDKDKNIFRKWMNENIFSFAIPNYKWVRMKWNAENEFNLCVEKQIFYCEKNLSYPFHKFFLLVFLIFYFFFSLFPKQFPSYFFSIVHMIFIVFKNDPWYLIRFPLKCDAINKEPKIDETNTRNEVQNGLSHRNNKIIETNKKEAEVKDRMRAKEDEWHPLSATKKLTVYSDDEVFVFRGWFLSWILNAHNLRTSFTLKCRQWRRSKRPVIFLFSLLLFAAAQSDWKHAELLNSTQWIPLTHFLCFLILFA